MRVCEFCRMPKAPVNECICDDEERLISLDPLPPVPYDGPVHDADGDDGTEGEAA